jgi:deazaflavin-dependent oxidoreductase (nitroreductase family)
MDASVSRSSGSPTTVEPKAVPIPRWLVRGFWRGHRLLYALTGGRLGLRPPTADRYGMLVLRTLGRQSGKERQAILAYFEDGRDLVIVPMNGWAAPEPAWWLNLQAQPEATVDMPDGTRLVRARLADPEEHARLWATAAAGPWGQDMDAYAVGRGRDTVIVILEPRAEGGSIS